MKVENTTRLISPKGTLSMEELEQILIYFSTSLFSKESISDLLWDLAHKCIAHLGFVDCVVYLVDEDRKVLVQKAALGPKNPEKQEILHPIEIPLGSGITGTVALTGQAEITRDTTLDNRYIVDNQLGLSEITVPILLDDRVIGIIDSEHPKKNYFTEQHLRLLTAVASICGNKIKHVQNEERRTREQLQLAELKAHALKANLSPHFVFNALNAIQYFITSGEKDAAIRYLSVFSKLIRYHLRHYEADTVLLEDELTMLDGYLQLQRLRYQDQFDYEILHQLSRSQQQVKIPTLVLSSLMEHAVERSIMQTNGSMHESRRLQLSLALGETLEVRLSYQLAHGKRQAAEYRCELVPWEEQVNRLNQLKDYHIRSKTLITPHAHDDEHSINIHIFIPILVA